jgi:histidyl-tRNA synthetase
VQLLKTHAQANAQKICKDCKVRLKKNPLRILDCKEEKCRVVVNQAPKMTEHLCDPCTTHFKDVKALLGEMQIPFKENPHLVRGLDYYTRTVFEVIPTVPKAPEQENAADVGTAQAAPGAILGGGRYDGLVELFGGSPTAAMGFSGGVERIIQAMKNEGVEAQRADIPEVFLVHLGELGRKRALRLFDDLRRAGFRVGEAFHKAGIKPQLRAADRAKIPWALILGQKEALDQTVILRNMESGVQETLDLNLDSLIPVLKKRLRREE